VYYGLRNDPVLEGQSKAAQPDALTLLIGLPLGVVVMAAILGAIVWLERFLAGGNRGLLTFPWVGQCDFIAVVVGRGRRG